MIRSLAVSTLTLYVSPRGDDRWSGRLPESNRAGTDGPLATPGRALALLRGRPGRVLLRGGIYASEATLAIGAEDTGVLLAAYPGERPVLHGGVSITSEGIRLEGLSFRGAGIELRDAENCTLYDCRVTAADGYAVAVEGGREHRILAGVFAGTGGVKLAGDAVTLSDCVIRGGWAGAWVEGRDCRVRHCAISTGTVGCVVMTGGGSRIEANRIHDVSIGVWVAAPCAQVRGNVLHGVRLGIHAADCAAVLFEDNLVEATHAGYCQHGGRDHLLRNNIIAGGLTCAAAGPVRPAMLEGNILHGRCEWDDRLLAWRNWHDTPHSSLRDDAPALAYGFGPLDATLAGPRLGDVLPRSADGWDEEPDLPAPIVHCRLQPTAPRAFTLTVENIGAAPALGEIALRVSPADAGTIDGNTELPLALLPGEQAAVPGTVTFRPGHTRLLLETLPRGEGILPTAVYLTTGDNG